MNKKKKSLSFRFFKVEGVKIERLLIIIFSICFALLILAQVLMTFPNARMFLTQEEKVEGVFLEKSDALYDKGVVVIELINHERIDAAWVLVNGQKKVNFTGKQVSISVKDTDLIEVDGTKVDGIIKVRIASCSTNIDLLIDNSVLDIDGNIGVLARARLK